MQLYKTHRYEGDSPIWFRTRDEAHAYAKGSASMSQARILLEDYPSDQTNFCTLFNGIRPPGKKVREWCLTPRGGLHEIKEGEKAPTATQALEAKTEEPQQAARDLPDAATFWNNMNAQQRALKKK